MTAGLDQSGIRRLNTSAALRELAVSAEAVTMTALAERTGLSRRTIELILDALVEAGWVAERHPQCGSFTGTMATVSVAWA